MDAPSRGHDLKRLKMKILSWLRNDAPSRGHDLKLAGNVVRGLGNADAPSRGHDLKPLLPVQKVKLILLMPPHGGMT